MTPEEWKQLEVEFQQRMVIKRELEEQDEKQKSEQLRQAYLKRTGRTSMEP